MSSKDDDYDKGVAEVKAYYDFNKLKGEIELTARTKNELIKQLFLRGLALSFAVGVFFVFLFYFN